MMRSDATCRILNFQIEVAGSQIEGSALCNQELMLGLAQHENFEIDIAAHAFPGSEQYDRTTYRTRGIGVHRAPVEYEYEGQPSSIDYLRRFRRFTKDLLSDLSSRDRLPDVFVMGHESFVWVQDIGRAFGIPTVVHLRGTPTREITNGIYPPEQTRAFLDNVLQCDWIVPLGQHFHDQMKWLGADPHRMFTFFNGYEDSVFHPRPRDHELAQSLGIRPGQRVVSTASVFYPVKQIHDIIESADDVLDRHDDVVYLILGDGPEGQRLEAKRKNARNRDRILMPGRVPREEMARYLCLADIYICASQSEGLSRSTVEASACGLYLLMSAMPAGFERTGHGSMGTNFRPSDPRDLTRATLDVLALNPNDFDAIRTKGRHYVEQHYKRSEQTPKYARFLEQIARSS